jgi:hypothetical protein
VFNLFINLSFGFTQALVVDSLLPLETNGTLLDTHNIPAREPTLTPFGLATPLDSTGRLVVAASLHMGFLATWRGLQKQSCVESSAVCV